MNANDVLAAMKALVALNYARWQRHAEPVKPNSKEAELMIVEAMNEALKAAIDERKNLS